MTVLQRWRAFKTTALAVVLVSQFFLQPAIAGDGDEDARQPLFSCGTDVDGGEGYLDLSGIEADFAVWKNLRFDRIANTTGDLVYSFPPDGTDYKTAFLFSHSDGPEGYLVSIRWEDGGADYVYYSLYVPPDSSSEDDVGGGEAGLVVSKNGEPVEHVTCQERPYMFISYLRESMSCDAMNPYGPAACEDDAPYREVPLDVETIGIVR